MTPQQYIDPQWDYGADSPQLTSSKAPQPEVLLAAFAERYRNEGRDIARRELEHEIQEKDKTIAELKNQLAISLNRISNIQPAEPTPNYNFNYALFPKPYGATIIDVLIELCDCRRERKKYVLNKKTDWYIVWKVLHYFMVYLGNEFDFIDLVNECVVENLSAQERKKRFSLRPSNFTTIKSDLPIKILPVCKWRKAQNEDLESCANRSQWHGDSALERGIVIMVKLQELLKSHHIDSINYERI